jgi:hypothetical protein
MTDLAERSAALAAHESGHATVALLAGLNVRRVSAPPLKLERDLPLAVLDPELPAGHTDIQGGDRRARACCVLGGPLGEGMNPPAWPLEPCTSDERKLARLTEGFTEFEWCELVRDTRDLLAKGERLHMTMAELLQHGVELDEHQLDDLRKALEADDPKPDSDCERDPEGLISDAEVERCREELWGPDITSVCVTSNGNGKALRDETSAWMYKSMVGIREDPPTITSFDC